VRVLRLSPYSPELNSVERLWDIAKNLICNRLWSDLATLETVSITTLNKSTNSAATAGQSGTPPHRMKGAGASPVLAQTEAPAGVRPSFTRF
jgi:hypothetical protein